MKYLLSLIFVLLLNGISAQYEFYKFLEEYYGDSDTYVVPGSMLRTVFNNEENPESLEAIQDINKIVYSNTPESDNILADFNKISKHLTEELGMDEYIRVSGALKNQFAETIGTDALDSVVGGAAEIGLYMSQEDGIVNACYLLAKFEDKVSIFPHSRRNFDPGKVG